LLREGLIAWSAKDCVKAIHVLVPQIEAALRDVLAALGASVMEHRPETGGFEAIGMGRILHHERFRTRVPPDIRSISARYAATHVASTCVIASHTGWYIPASLVWG